MLYELTDDQLATIEAMIIMARYQNYANKEEMRSKIDSVEAALRTPAQPATQEPSLPLQAIGYCWRWAQLYAEKIDDENRYKFMCGEIDKVVLWEEEMKRRRPQPDHAHE